MMKRKWLAVGIILLFVGVTIAPSINQSVVKASNENDFVEVTTELCGLPGIKQQSMTLSKHQLNEIETSLYLLESSFLQSKTLHEKVNIFNQIIDVLNRYGLLGNVNIGYLKMFFNQSIRALEQVVKSIFDTNKISNKSEDRIFENICCLVFSIVGRGSSIAFFSSPLRTYFIYLIANKLYYSNSTSDNLKDIVSWILLFIEFQKYIFFLYLPFAFNSWTIIGGYESYVHSIGLYGYKKQYLVYTYVDLFGFFGIKIQYNMRNEPNFPPSFRNGFLIGFAFAISKT